MKWCGVASKVGLENVSLGLASTNKSKLSPLIQHLKSSTVRHKITMGFFRAAMINMHAHELSFDNLVLRDFSCLA
jgi:hypothetical protein